MELTAQQIAILTDHARALVRRTEAASDYKPGSHAGRQKIREIEALESDLARYVIRILVTEA